MTNAEAWFNIALHPRKPEGSVGRTAQDGHLDSHTAPELCQCLSPASCSSAGACGLLNDPRTPLSLPDCIVSAWTLPTLSRPTCRRGPDTLLRTPAANEGSRGTDRGRPLGTSTPNQRVGKAVSQGVWPRPDPAVYSVGCLRFCPLRPAAANL